MLFKRFYDDQLAQASYMLACEDAGLALIVDPNRDIDFYTREAAREKVRIAYVTETHIHADFLSGSRELAQKAGAQLLLSDEGGDDWRYDFAAASNAVLLRDGSNFSFGNVHITAMHTPGHTPEHLVFLVTDRASSTEPVGMFSGDLLFVGDVGRPDLLEKAAKQAGTMESAARTLHESLQRLNSLPDFLQVWPGHGAGSACGKSLGAMPQSTLGFERISNWALQTPNEDDFVRSVLSDQPAPPRYFGLMKVLNKQGPAILGKIEPPVRLNVTDLGQIVKSGASLVDTRSAEAFTRSHLPGSLHIPFNKSFCKWAGSVLDYGRDVVLVVDEKDAATAMSAKRSLAMIGIDLVRGFATAADFPEWQSAGNQLTKAKDVSVSEAAALIRSGSVNILDVRDDHELETGYLPGMRHIPLTHLADRIAEVATDKPLLVYCRTGNRSVIASSLLKARGVQEPLNLAGGIVDWRKEGQDVEREDRVTVSG